MNCVSPWYNRNGWLGFKNKLPTYLPTYLYLLTYLLTYLPTYPDSTPLNAGQEEITVSTLYLCASWLLACLLACLLGWLVTHVDAGRIQSQHTLLLCALPACLAGWLVGCWLVQFSPSARALQDYFRKSLQLVGWSVNWYVHPMLYWPLYYLPASHFVVSVCYSDPVGFFPSFLLLFLPCCSCLLSLLFFFLCVLVFKLLQRY